MNKLHTIEDPARRAELLQTRFARRLTALLSEQTAAHPRPDIDERLRVAREQAIARARQSKRLSSVAVAASGSVGVGNAAVLSGGPAEDTPWWLRLSSLLPLAVLLAGLLWIDRHHTMAQIDAAVEVDAAILADDLPPEAYRDPGFAEFLKSNRP
jgi:protein-S-isoprenylcysteine O-methyltransferase Ste14